MTRIRRCEEGQERQTVESREPARAELSSQGGCRVSMWQRRLDHCGGQSVASKATGKIQGLLKSSAANLIVL